MKLVVYTGVKLGGMDYASRPGCPALTLGHTHRRVKLFLALPKSSRVYGVYAMRSGRRNGLTTTFSAMSEKWNIVS